MHIDELEVGGVMIKWYPNVQSRCIALWWCERKWYGARDRIKYAIEEMTEMKLVCIKNKIENLKTSLKNE